MSTLSIQGGLTLSIQGGLSRKSSIPDERNPSECNVDTVDTRFIRYLKCTIEDREQRKGLCRHCRYKDQSMQCI